MIILPISHSKTENNSLGLFFFFFHHENQEKIKFFKLLKKLTSKEQKTKEHKTKKNISLASHKKKKKKIKFIKLLKKLTRIEACISRNSRNRTTIFRNETN